MRSKLLGRDSMGLRRRGDAAGGGERGAVRRFSVAASRDVSGNVGAQWRDRVQLLEIGKNLRHLEGSRRPVSDI